MTSIESAFSEIQELAGRLEAGFMLASIALYFLTLIVWSLRWAIASRVEVGLFSVSRLLESILVGVLVNNLVSLYSVGGEVARIAWATYRGRFESTRLLAGVAVERVSEIPIALVYVLLFLKFVHGNIILYLHVPSLLKRGGDYARLTLKSARESMSSPGLLATLVALSLALWLLDSIRLYLLARSVGVHVDLVTATSLTLLGIASRILVLTPGNIGVFESVYIGFLNASGYTLGDAAAVALAERMVSSVMPSLIGTAIVLREGGFATLRRIMGRTKGALE